MLCTSYIFFYFIYSVSTLTFKLGGSLQLGPNWQYKYKFDIPDENEAVFPAKNGYKHVDPSTSENEENPKKLKVGTFLVEPKSAFSKPSVKQKHKKIHHSSRYTVKYYPKPSSKRPEILKIDSDGDNSNSDSDGDEEYHIKKVTKPLIEAIKSTTEPTYNVRQQVSNKNKNLHENVFNEFYNPTENWVQTDKIQFGSEIPNFLDTLKDESENKAREKAKEMAIEIATEDIRNNLNKFKKPAQQWVQNLKNDRESAIKDKISGMIHNVINKSQGVLANKVPNFYKTAQGWKKIENNTQMGNTFNQYFKRGQKWVQTKNETLNNLKNQLNVISNKSKVPFQSNTYKIADDVLINSFTKDILERTLRLFEIVAKRSTEYHWKKRIRHLARSYEDKFNEFLRATKRHTVKTRLGSRKVILNAIDESNRIVTRLFNYISDDMEKKGLIYNNLTPKILRAELNKEEKRTLKKACEEFGICRNQKGFNEFIFDVLTIMLSATNSKFEKAFKAIARAAIRTDFSLGDKTNKDLKTKVIFAERQNVNVQRGVVMILKNIIANRNIPLVLYNSSDSVDNKMESTLALLDIVNTLDANVPYNANNLKEWDIIRRDLEDWLEDKNVDIDDTMGRLVTNIQNTIKNVDYSSWAVILNDAKLLLK